MADYTYTNLDRARDAVANSDWEDIGYTDPYTIAQGYAFFDRVIRQVKAEAWDEGYEAGADDQAECEGHRYRDTPEMRKLGFDHWTTNPYES